MDKPGDSYGTFWRYISQNQRDLILEGQYLMDDIIKNQAYKFKDYSFLIFPFAKAYEGFLKQIFLDAGMISRVDYISDHLRLGKLMSPHLIGRLGDKSLYKKVLEKADRNLAEQIWMTWKLGRNQVFHYFPHNLKAVDFEDSYKSINHIIKTMEVTYERLKPADSV